MLRLKTCNGCMFGFLPDQGIKDYPPERVMEILESYGLVVESIDYQLKDGDCLVIAELWEGSVEEARAIVTKGDEQLSTYEPKTNAGLLPDEGTYFMVTKRISLPYWSKGTPINMEIRSGDYVQLVAVYPTMEMVLRIVDGEFQGQMASVKQGDWLEVSKSLKRLEGLPAASLQGSNESQVEKPKEGKMKPRRELGMSNGDSKSPYVKSGSFARIKKDFPPFKEFKKGGIKDYMTTDLDELELKKKKERDEMMKAMGDDGGGRFR